MSYSRPVAGDNGHTTVQEKVTQDTRRDYNTQVKLCTNALTCSSLTKISQTKPSPSQTKQLPYDNESRRATNHYQCYPNYSVSLTVPQTNMDNKAERYISYVTFNKFQYSAC
jgi:hypothetical protein